MIPKMLEKNSIFSLILMTLGVTLVIISSADTAYAKHEGSNQFLEFERHTWSRTLTDGHTDYLNCGTGTNSDKCAVEIKILNNISNSGVTKANVSSEISTIETRFDNINKKISFDKVAASDNYITSTNYGSLGNIGFTDYELHCINQFLWHCITKDNHFKKMILNVNSHNSMNWDITEICNIDNQPTQRDIEKTLGHELLHVIGIDHNSVSTDLRFNGYQCGSNFGYDLSTADKNKIGSKYP